MLTTANKIIIITMLHYKKSYVNAGFQNIFFAAFTHLMTLRSDTVSVLYYTDTVLCEWYRHYDIASVYYTKDLEHCTAILWHQPENEGKVANDT